MLYPCPDRLRASGTGAPDEHGRGHANSLCCERDHPVKARDQRPRDIANRMIERRRSPSDGYKRETFRLPRPQAREKARELLSRFPQQAYMTVVESWSELPGD